MSFELVPRYCNTFSVFSNSSGNNAGSLYMDISKSTLLYKNALVDHM